jgi:hypothetical protein
VPLRAATCCRCSLQVLLQGLPGGALEVAQGAVQETEQAGSSSSDSRGSIRASSAAIGSARAPCRGGSSALLCRELNELAAAATIK